MNKKKTIFYRSVFETPCGPLLAIGDVTSLYAVHFMDERTTPSFQFETVEKEVFSLNFLKKELDLYFKGELFEFNVPITLFGTPFQRRVWEELRKIPFGQTASYSDIANGIQNPLSVRAVAQANRRNPFAIIIPCHRVINKDGALGGYNGGVFRKEWLLSFEKNNT